MARVDSLALANKKNLVGKSRLQSELNRISREKQTVMRLMNNEKQRFKSKYSKFDVLSEHRGTEPSDVVMYETHNPGFCYRRNGECRMPQSPIKNTSLGFEDIHVLIFTEGELDIDKVLCLHLLSAHRTETLTPPPKSQRSMMFIARQRSPLERLLERNKRRWPEDRLTKLLPIYVIDYCRNDPYSKTDNLIRDGRLAARLVVNEKVNILIRSIMIALDKTNRTMLDEMIEKARDENYLKNMLNKSSMQDFVKNLNGLNVISCCESFCLTLPFRVIPKILDVKTPSGQLENLVKQIRKNIFKLPINCCWDDDLASASFYSNSEDDLTPFLDSPSQKEREICTQNLDVNEFPAKSGQVVLGSSSVNETFQENAELTPSDGRSTTNEVNSPRSAGRNVILCRKRSPITVNINKDNDKRDKVKRLLDLQQIREMDFEKVAKLVCTKANNAIKRDKEYLERSQKSRTNMQSQKSVTNQTPKPQEHQQAKHEPKILLKQTKCAACMEKWRQPLPTPKTCCIHKHALNTLDDETLQNAETNSSHLLSALIDQELRFWKDFKVSTTDSNQSSPRYGFMSASSIDKNNIIEIIDLNELDLARVRQQIREHETKKKLEHFLNS